MDTADIIGVGACAWFIGFLISGGIVFGTLEMEENKTGYMMVVLWPLTLVILSPVILVKLVAVLFKRRGLIGAYASGIANVYKGAVK